LNVDCLVEQENVLLQGPDRERLLDPMAPALGGDPRVGLRAWSRDRS
jgi:hypothetical protein